MSAFDGRTVRAGQTPRLSQRSLNNGRWAGSAATRGLALVAALLAFLAMSGTPALAWDDDNNPTTTRKISGRCPGVITKNTILIGDIIWQPATAANLTTVPPIAAAPADPIPCITFGASNI